MDRNELRRWVMHRALLMPELYDLNDETWEF